MLRNPLAVVIALWALHVIAWGQPVDSVALDRIMREALQAWQAPGAAIAVVKGDEVVLILEDQLVKFVLGRDGEVASMELLGQTFKKIKPKPEARSTGGVE